MSAAVLRAIDVVHALEGHNFRGLRLKQIADLVKQSSATTLRDLQTLESAGWAQRIPGNEDCWRLGRRPLRLALAHQSEVARHQRELDDFANSVSR
jgi:DNA-binding IclR family transcriptional regulator